MLDILAIIVPIYITIALGFVTTRIGVFATSAERWSIFRCGAWGGGSRRLLLAS